MHYQEMTRILMTILQWKKEKKSICSLIMKGRWSRVCKNGHYLLDCIFLKLLCNESWCNFELKIPCILLDLIFVSFYQLYWIFLYDNSQSSIKKFPSNMNKFLLKLRHFSKFEFRKSRFCITSLSIKHIFFLGLKLINLRVFIRNLAN